MAEQKISFHDGAAYEQMMGAWSKIAGDIFIDWIAPGLDLRWVDVGCGNGAFTRTFPSRADAAWCGLPIRQLDSARHPWHSPVDDDAGTFCRQTGSVSGQISVRNKCPTLTDPPIFD